MGKTNVTNIVLGTLGTALSSVGGMLADQKVTVGEIWTTTMDLGSAIVDAIPGAAGVQVYRVAGKTKTVGQFLEAIHVTVSTGLSEFGVDGIVVGNVK